MIRLKDMKMFTKIFGMAMVVVAVIAAPVFMWVVPKIAGQIREDKKIQTRALTQTAYNIMDAYYKQYKSGLMSEEGAKKEALNVIKELRYEGENYFWVQDTHPRVVMHPIKPELNGTDVTESKDSSGKKLFVEFVKACEQSGEGQVDYMWPKPGFSKPQPKVSYVKIFKPWGWIVGTGIYVDDVKAIVSGIVWFVIGILGTGILLAFLIAFFVGKTMTAPLNAIIAMVKDMAQGEGDLTKRIDLDSRDEVGDLARWFNAFIDQLHELIVQIANVTLQAASASEESSAASEQLASGAQQQQAQTSQVATSVEEMSATVQEVAKNANEAAVSAKGAGETAKKGGEIMQQTVEGIKRIADSSRATAESIQILTKNSEKIGNIIGVIDDVADQTNLLALNAAIEAARAGEQGRGFAVVADEVRKLAERTSSSTKEISEMVKAMQEGTVQAASAMERGMKDVDNGVKLAEQAGNTLREIVGAAQKVGDLIQQVATATEEQSAAAEEISSNVESVASVSKQAAMGVQQIAEASQEVSTLAERLQAMVNMFKLQAGSVQQVERKVKEKKA